MYVCICNIKELLIISTSDHWHVSTYIRCSIYRVIHKSLRDFRTLRYSSRNGHTKGEHFNRGRDFNFLSYCTGAWYVHPWWLLRAPNKLFSHTLDSLRQWSWLACLFNSVQAATLLEYLYHSRIVLCGTWSKTSVPSSWLSYGKFQDKEHFVIPCPRHVSSRLPQGRETCIYATVLSTKKNWERYSTYWYATFCCVCLGCCAAEFRISGGTYEFPVFYTQMVLFVVPWV